MIAPACALCGEALHSYLQSYPRKYQRPDRLMVTCENKNCPALGRTLSPDEHSLICDTLRHEIVLSWTFDQCLARPCPATLTAALMILVEASAVARYKVLRDGYCRFVCVCWLPDLLSAAESLMSRCVCVNGAETSDYPVNGGLAVCP